MRWPLKYDTGQRGDGEAVVIQDNVGAETMGWKPLCDNISPDCLRGPANQRARQVTELQPATSQSGK